MSVQRALERRSTAKALAKSVLASVGILKTASRIKWQFKRGFGYHDKLLASSYLSTAKVAKLHIGCGNNVLAGWLNADYFPYREDILHLDATKPFCLLQDNSFEFVFSEHMIEHICYFDAVSMLRECHRVLRNGGRIRISTPDLIFLVNLMRDEKSDLQKNYIKWSAITNASKVPHAVDTFVINNFVRDWGHQFIYDEKTLRAALEEAGFRNVIRCNLQSSNSEHLCNLENEQRMPEKFLRLETLTIEGTKGRER